MKLLILMVLPFVASVARAQTAATKTAIENKMQDQKTSTVFTYARLGEKLFCVPKVSRHERSGDFKCLHAWH